ncbi:hypothetical protein PIB30_070261 [Stylosanthes scabra]|uniref:Uncharacterized protein n=1 Tax=Stylosanthes scabra TaxID=79078 RepID=A0ABU6YP91_9FABA|nr:hypothetical protein [Stylosanthes scabra]
MPPPLPPPPSSAPRPPWPPPVATASAPTIPDQHLDVDGDHYTDGLAVAKCNTGPDIYRRPRRR